MGAAKKLGHVSKSPLNHGFAALHCDDQFSLVVTILQLAQSATESGGGQLPHVVVQLANHCQIDPHNHRFIPLKIQLSHSSPATVPEPGQFNTPSPQHHQPSRTSYCTQAEHKVVELAQTLPTLIHSTPYHSTNRFIMPTNCLNDKNYPIYSQAPPQYKPATPILGMTFCQK